MFFKCPQNVFFVTLFCLEKSVMLLSGDEKMNIATFIQNHKELSELPFLIVFRTLSILKEMNMLKFTEDNADVETTQ